MHLNNRKNEELVKKKAKQVDVMSHFHIIAAKKTRNVTRCLPWRVFSPELWLRRSRCWLRSADGSCSPCARPKGKRKNPTIRYTSSKRNIKYQLNLQLLWAITSHLQQSKYDKLIALYLLLLEILQLFGHYSQVGVAELNLAGQGTNARLLV